MARFTNRGNIEVRFFAQATSFTDSTKETITDAEMSSSTNVQHGPGSDGECISDLGGWQLTQSSIDVPDLCSNVTGSIPGEITTGEAYLEYYDDDTSTPTKDLFVEGLEGFIAISPQGLAIGKKGELWPVKVQANRDLLNVGNEAAKFRIDFTTSKPTKFAIVA